MKPLIPLAFFGLLTAGSALAQTADPYAAQPYRSPRYPAITSAPPAAGTSISAPGTRITNESSAETATGITGSGDRDRRRRGATPY